MTHDRSAAEAEENEWRNGSNAANSMVESSATKNVAMLAIQKMGQGFTLSGDVFEAEESEVFILIRFVNLFWNHLADLALSDVFARDYKVLNG